MNDQPTADSHDPTLLRGDGRYGFTARIEGDDLVVRGVRATWFGGAHDPMDNGQTASGVSTRLHPGLLGCALPMNGFRLTRGSPLPNLPWQTKVEIFHPASSRHLTVSLIDLGPSAPPHAHAAIDLTVAAFRALGGDLKTGVLHVDFRIPGAARRLPGNLLAAVRAPLRGAPVPQPRTAMGNPIGARSAAVGSRSPASAVPLPPALADAAGATTPAAAAATVHAPGGTATGRVGRAVPPSGRCLGAAAALGVCLVSTACATMEQRPAWPEVLTLTASAGHDEPGGWDRATVGVRVTWQLQPVRVAASTDASVFSF